MILGEIPQISVVLHSMIIVSKIYLQCISLISAVGKIVFLLHRYSSHIYHFDCLFSLMDEIRNMVVCQL